MSIATPRSAENLPSFSVHPAAERFPMMGEEELRALAEDIRVNGQQHRVVYFAGQLLDGRNRIAACRLIGIEPKATTLAECKSPTSYIVSSNLKRRQLTRDVSTALSVDPVILASKRAEAKARQHEGQKSGGRGNKKLPSTNEGEFSGPKFYGEEAVSQSAKDFGVSRTNAYAMLKVQKKAPEVYEAVKRGEMSVVDAKRVLVTPPPKSKDPRVQRRDERDQRVKVLHETLGPTEIAKELGCSVAAVHDSKRRLGLTDRETNPLRRLTDYAIEFCDAWEIALATDVSQWASAAPEHIAELTKHLERLKRKTSNLIHRLNKEAKGDH